VKPLPLPPPAPPVPEITRTEATMFMALAFRDHVDRPVVRRAEETRRREARGRRRLPWASWTVSPKFRVRSSQVPSW